jgi:prepilin-type N-terminal cleavage/methylation domain-containing protein
MSKPANRAGFTLLELLVVLGIIGVLLALLLPAVQQVRQAAARIACVNNLKQMGLAAYGYHDAVGYFPQYAEPGSGGPHQPSDTGRRSWMSVMLPYLEQTAAYNGGGVGDPIKTYQCPADSNNTAVCVLPPSRAMHGETVWGETSYCGVYGSVAFLTDGIITAQATRMTDITDGASNTLMVGERPVSPDQYWGWWGQTDIGDSLLWALNP